MCNCLSGVKGIGEIRLIFSHYRIINFTAILFFLTFFLAGCLEMPPKISAMKTLFTLIAASLVGLPSFSQVIIQQTTVTTTYTTQPGYPYNGQVYLNGSTPFYPNTNMPYYGNPYRRYQRPHRNVYQTGLVLQGSQNSYNPSNPVQCGTVGTDQGMYSMILQAVANQSFDQQKLQMANQIVTTNHLNAQQITGIMNLFSFESTKLEFAKFAYRFVTDPGNYFVVNNTFSFSSSVNELNNYLMTCRN